MSMNKIMINAFEHTEKPYDRDPSKNTFADFLLNAGLYQETYEISKENIQDVIDVIKGYVRINVYCKECGEERIFSLKEMLFPFEVRDEIILRGLGDELASHQSIQAMVETPRPNEKITEKEWYWTNWQTQDYTRVMVFSYKCALNEQHFTDYIVRADGNIVRKIGQYPSIADLSFPELENYKNVLSKKDRKEFRRAIGLYSSGIGVGAYVYLRRIFERMLDTAKDNAIQDGVILQDYEKVHVNERIKMLRDYLPKALVENQAFYGIVSKGIHELSEEDCIAYFPILRDFLFLIMRQWEQQRQERETEKQLAKSLSKIVQEIK